MTGREAVEQAEARRHTTVLEALAYERRHYEALGVGMEHHLAVVDGRRRILERHHPDRVLSGATASLCPQCTGYGDTPTEWPCDDYTDAAADALEG